MFFLKHRITHLATLFVWVRHPSLQGVFDTLELRIQTKESFSNKVSFRAK